ncbi:MAG: Holliday junction DNA helicase RuvB C-terminal domain-containing protein, partial [Pseudomonadota bacterium]
AEDRGTIEDVYEPFLLKEGFLLRTPRGRMNSDKARAHIRKTNPKLVRDSSFI